MSRDAGERPPRRVVVTGGGRGIGRAVTEAFLGRGDRVTVLDLDPGESLRTMGVSFERCDLGDPAQVAAAGGRILADGRVDVVVHNAAAFVGGSCLDATPADWARAIAVNLTGPFLLNQALVADMVRGGVRGQVVLISSINGVTGAERHSLPYAVTKHGLIGMMRSMAVDLAPHGIRVNAVAPGTIDTPSAAPAYADPEVASGIRALVPLGRVGRPREVAAVVVALCDPFFSYVTGTTVVVDGGYSMFTPF